MSIWRQWNKRLTYSKNTYSKLYQRHYTDDSQRDSTAILHLRTYRRLPIIQKVIFLKTCLHELASNICLNTIRDDAFRWYNDFSLDNRGRRIGHMWASAINISFHGFRHMHDWDYSLHVYLRIHEHIICTQINYKRSFNCNLRLCK